VQDDGGGAMTVVVGCIAVCFDPTDGPALARAGGEYGAEDAAAVE
jgi:hypothetical protein